MRIPRIVEAMTDIDDDLITGAIEYRRIPLLTRIFHSPGLKGCACLLAVAVVFSTIIYIGKNQHSKLSPFVLTAYAVSSEDNHTTASTLEKGKKVPISTFEWTNRLMGFMVSCNKENKNQPSSVSIISGVDYDSFEEIMDIAVDQTQDYYFFVPGETEEEPYMFPLFLTNKEKNLICQYEIAITEVDGDYYAELIEESIMERGTK